MSRIGITFEEVKTAIAELQGRQKNPTVDAVREILGTGSKSTIARYLREWKAKHGLSSDSDGCLPSDLLGIVNGLWDALRNKADAQIDRYRQESDTQSIQIKQQLTEARQLEASLQQTIHTLEEELHQQKEENRQLAAKLMTEAQDKIRYSERVSVLESRRKEHIEENQRLHQLLKHVQENLEHYQAATQKLREEQSLLMERQRNDYEQRLAQLLGQDKIINSEKAALQAQHDQLRKAHESCLTENKIFSTQYREMQNQHESLKLAQEKIQHEYNVIKDKLQTQASELAMLSHMTTEQKVNLKSKDEKIFLLEDTLKKANDKIESLRYENQFVLQEKFCLEGQLKQMQAMLSLDKVASN